MKKYLKESIILSVQLLAFYVLPLFAGPTDIMGLVILIILATFITSLNMGALSGRKLKYLYPIVVAALFLPSVFIYYNESALIHSVWYLVISAVGLLIGTVIRIIFTSKRFQDD